MPSRTESTPPEGAEAVRSTGRRERTKAANRQAILDAALRVFGDVGYGASSVRDIVRETNLATGTFYNYFPDKEAVLRVLVDETAAATRIRVRAARQAAVDAESFVRDGFRAYFEHLASDPRVFEVLRRNAGTIRALFEEPAIGAGTTELAEDLRAAVAAGIVPDLDCDYTARAMAGAAFEVAVLMLEREPVDVDAAVACLSGLFLGGIRSAR